MDFLFFKLPKTLKKIREKMIRLICRFENTSVAERVFPLKKWRFLAFF